MPKKFQLYDDRQKRNAPQRHRREADAKFRAARRGPGVDREDACGLFIAGRTIASPGCDAPRQHQLHQRARAALQQGPRFRPQEFPVGPGDVKPRAAGAEARQVALKPARPPLLAAQGLEQPIPVLEPAIMDRDHRLRHAVHERWALAGTRLRLRQRGTHPPASTVSPPKARNMPRALERVSASSRCQSESATMPAPARNCSSRPRSVAVRISMLKSMSPLQFRYPSEPV